MFFRYLTEKRNPWIFRSYYHPAWYKRDPDDHAVTSNKAGFMMHSLK